MSSRHRKSSLHLSLSRGVVGGDVKCTEHALQDVTNCCFAQPVSSATEACTQLWNRLSRVWAHSSWIGCAHGSSYALHHQSRHHEKGTVSQPLLRRCFRRLLLTPIRPFTIPIVGHLSLGSPHCRVVKTEDK